MKECFYTFRNLKTETWSEKLHCSIKVKTNYNKNFMSCIP